MWPAKGRITKLYDFKANGREPIESASAGDIVAFSGLPDITIGNTLCDPSKVEPLPFLKINDPTVEMTFSVNDSPFAGREGKFVTSRQIRDRLQKELLKDRGSACGRLCHQRFLPRDGPWRDAPVHPHRDHAPRRLRAAGQPPEGSDPCGERQDHGAHGAGRH